MWAMRSDDKQELDAYRALGTVDSVKMRLMRLDFIDWAEKQMLHPAFAGNGDGYAPLPMSDPAMACVEAYECAWDYPTQEQQKRYSGLLEEDA